MNIKVIANHKIVQQHQYDCPYEVRSSKEGPGDLEKLLNLQR